MCQQNLRDLLTGADPGGTWTYIGYNQTSSSGPWENTPAVPLVTTPIGGTMTGDNPLINPLGKTAGYYRFRYSVFTTVTSGVCVDDAFVTVHVVDRTCAGNVRTKTVCVGTPVNIIQELQVGSSCTVTAGTITPSFPNNIFTPSVAGTTIFTNTVDVIPDAGFDLLCTNCNTSATLTVNAVSSANVGTLVNSPRLIICDYSNPINLQDLLTGEAINGSWYFATSPSGAPAYSGATLTVNSNLFNNTTQFITPGTKLTNATNIATVNFNQAAKGFDYRFRYVVNEGLPCEASAEVILYTSEPLNSGTATNDVVCFYDIIPSIQFAPPPFNLSTWLTGESGSGSWSITSNPARPIKINLNWNRGSQDAYDLNRGLDDTFNFLNFRNTAWLDPATSLQKIPAGSAFAFNFVYSTANALPGNTLGCTPSQTSFTKTVIFTYDSGDPVYGSYNVGCGTTQSFALSSLLTLAEIFGNWYVAPTVLASSSVAIPNLIVGTGGQTTYQPGTLIAPGNSATVDFANVPNGIYYLVYACGTLWTGPNQCPSNTVVQIVKSCCSVTAGITNNTGTTVLSCNNPSISLTATGGTTYQWVFDGSTSPTLIVTQPGTYTVTATDSNGCTGQASIIITQDTSSPTSGVTNNTGTTVLTCTTPSISLTAFGGTYQWSGGLGTNATVTITEPGTYSVTITNPSNGCTSLYSIVITANTTPPNVTITTSTGSNEVGCDNNSITLTASGASSYLWNTGQTTAAITVATPGTYIVTGTNANGCTDVASQTIINCTTVDCNDFQATFTTANGQFNASSSQCANVTYAWTYNGNPVGTASSYTPNNGNGNYQVTVTCNTGLYDDCVDSNTFVCNVTLSLSQSGNTINSIVTGCGTYLYEWTGPAGFTATTPAISPTVSGVYSLRVACVESGCVSQQVSIEYQDCNAVTVDLTFPEDNVIGYSASGCGSAPTITWIISPPSGSPITSSGPTVTVPIYEGSCTVQLSYACKGCPPIILTHTIHRRTVVYTLKNFPIPVVLKNLTINGTDYIANNFPMSLTNSSTSLTTLLAEIDNVASDLKIPTTNITGSVAANPLINTPCPNASGQVFGFTLTIQSALIQGFNITNTFGVLEFDYTGNASQESGSAVIHPAYYISNGGPRILTTRITGAPLRNFSVDVDPADVYNGNPVTFTFGNTSFSINTLSGSCHNVFTSAVTLLNNTAVVQAGFNSYLSSNGGGSCTIQIVNPDTYKIILNNVVVPPNLFVRNLFTVDSDATPFKTKYYNFTEL